MNTGLRWAQRFSNFEKALSKLTEGIAYMSEIHIEGEETNQVGANELARINLLKEGLIQRFEYTHELAWNTMKDYARYQGNEEVAGSRDATREAFRLKLIEDGALWMEMIGSRNQTTHTYKEATADEIHQKICETYYPAMLQFAEVMRSKLQIADL